MLNARLLEVLACPICKGRLIYQKSPESLICLADALAFPVEDDIPILLAESAQSLSLEEVERLRQRT